jgi:hypothetical protein
VRVTYPAEFAPALDDRGYAMIAVSPQKPGSGSCVQVRQGLAGGL